MKIQPHADRWLRARRTREGLTQKELALKSGLTLRDIQRIEQGDLHMAYHKYVAVAEYFGVSLDEMLFGEVEEQ